MRPINESPAVKPGGIYRVTSSVSSEVSAAIVLVTDADHENTWAAVTLLSPDIEFITSEDLLLTPCDSGLPYQLIVHGDILGQLSFDQFERQIGNSASTVLASLRALHDDMAVGHAVAGPPLTQQSDPRWAFKLSELHRFQKLSRAPFPA